MENSVGAAWMEKYRDRRSQAGRAQGAEGPSNSRKGCRIVQVVGKEKHQGESERAHRGKLYLDVVLCIYTWQLYTGAFNA